MDNFVAVGEFHGTDAIVAFFTGFFVAVPDSRLEVERILADGSWTTVQYRVSGTFTGAPFLGVDPTGRRIELQAVSVAEWDDQLRIRQNTIYYDGAEFARQIGMLPAARLGRRPGHDVGVQCDDQAASQAQAELQAKCPAIRSDDELAAGARGSPAAGGGRRFAAPRGFAVDGRRRTGPTRSWLLEHARGAAAIVTDPSIPVDGELLDAAGDSLKVVSNFGVGYDNIDLDAARARGVRVTNTPDVLTNATAELAVALMLAAARRIAEADAIVRAWAVDGLAAPEECSAAS